MGWQLWLYAAVATIAVAILAILLVRMKRRTATPPAENPPPVPAPEALPTIEEPHKKPRIAFIINPSKNGINRVKARIDMILSEFEWESPIWLETTVDDPGVSQTKQALAEGVDVVVAVGGDGTVRTVAGVMAHTNTPLGIIPVGTGNLFARNLDLPLWDLDRLIRIAISGAPHLVDLGWVETNLSQERHPFLVIAGMGFDAQMVADTSDWLKARIGWIAYFMAGIRHLGGQRMRVTIAIDDEHPVKTKARTVLVGNCGRLPGNLVLIPDARIDDGLLDVVAVDPRGGLVGWTVLTGEVLTQGIEYAVAKKSKKRSSITMDHLSGQTCTVESEDENYIELDGDVIGRSSLMHVSVDPGAIIVHV